MQRNIFIVLLLLIFSSSAQAQFTFTSKVRTLRSLEASLYDLNDSLIFSGEIKKGETFTFGPVDIKPDLYRLVLGNYELKLLLPNSAVVMKGLLADMNPASTNLKFEGAAINDSLIMAESKFKEPGKGWSWDAIKSSYSALVLSSIIYNNIDFFKLKGDVLQEAVDAVTDEVEESLVIKRTYELYRSTRVFADGQKVKEFSLPDRDGKIHTLSSFRGKMLLLDFWASWCAPCRAEMKSLMAIYNEIKADDIVFVSISLDDSREKWVKALDTDQMPWISLWDQAGFDGSVFKEEFGFNAIPFIVLIDANGKIIKRGLRGEEVKNEIIKNKNRL